jgi:hypothetical protein
MPAEIPQGRLFRLTINRAPDCLAFDDEFDHLERMRGSDVPGR